MSLNYKPCANSTVDAVTILVIAPGGKVNVPVMKLKLKIAGRMSKIKTNCDTFVVSCFS